MLNIGVAQPSRVVPFVNRKQFRLRGARRRSELTGHRREAAQAQSKSNVSLNACAAHLLTTALVGGAAVRRRRRAEAGLDRTGTGSGRRKKGAGAKPDPGKNRRELDKVLQKFTSYGQHCDRTLEELIEYTSGLRQELTQTGGRASDEAMLLYSVWNLYCLVRY
eukprot:g38366.t1